MPIATPRAHRVWTPDDDATLGDQLGLVSDAALARRRGRTPAALRLRAARLGLKRTDNFLTARQVGAIMGVDSKVVRRWIDQGLLRAKKAPFKHTHPGRPWQILPATLERFIKQHPEQCDLARMPDSYYRVLLRRTAGPAHAAATGRLWSGAEDAYLLNNRRGKTQAELAAYLRRTPEAVYARIVTLRRAGRLVPYDKYWQTRAANGTATAPRRWTPEEDAYLRAHWGQERAVPAGWGTRHTAAEIALALGRTEQACWSRASRLELQNAGWTRADEVQEAA